MIVALFLIASVASISYRAGETFSYKYDSTVQTVANQEASETQNIEHHLTCFAKFKVLQISPDGAYLQMTIDNVISTVGNGDDKEDGQYDEDSELSFAAPLFFKHKTNGIISDVVASTEDDEDTISMKTGILYGLQTALTSGSGQQYDQVEVIDPQGSHFEFFQTTVEGETIIVQSHYSQDEFIAFADEDADESNIILEANSFREIVGERIVRSSGITTVLLNKAQGFGNDADQAAIEMTATGTATLSSYAQGNDEEVDFPFADVETFLNALHNLRRVPHLHPSFFYGRIPRGHREAIELDTLDTFKGCPGDIDFCKGFDNSWTVGNSNVGLRLSASANAGIKKGCKTDVRSYAVGAYANLDVLILGKTITAAAGYAEYGQVNGSPLRNGIELKLFGHVFYSKSFPWLDCIDRTIQLASFSKDFSFSYSILVYVVQIKFSVGISFTFRADLHYTVCPQQLKASCTLTPFGSATLHGGASASVAVAKAGVDIRGTISDYLDPTAYADGNICRVGFTMYNNLNPIEASLVGWWQTRTIKWHGLKTKITWGSKHEHVFWRHTWAGSRTKIVDVFYGAK